MKLKSLTLLCTLALFGATACQKTSPTRPSDDLEATSGSAAVTDASTGISVTSPQPTTPTANQTFKFADQPLTLTVEERRAHRQVGARRIRSTSPPMPRSPPRSTPRTASPKAAGTTSLKIDTLAGPAAKTYYWRSRLTSGTTVSQYSAVAKLQRRRPGRHPGAAGVVADRRAARSDRTARSRS